MTGLREQFGNIDIYLFDQLLRGRIAPGMRVLDAGCGGGRNLVYLLREDFDVFGVDASEGAIVEVHQLASALRPNIPSENFRHEPLEAMSFPGGELLDPLKTTVVQNQRCMTTWVCRKLQQPHP